MKSVKQIITWQIPVEQAESNNPDICVDVILDDNTKFIGIITKSEFDRMKDEELHFEIQWLIDSTSDRYGLCAWCKSYFNRKTGKAIHKLTDKQFEQTRRTGQSHSCCDSCRKTLKESTAKINIDIEINNQ